MSRFIPSILILAAVAPSLYSQVADTIKIQSVVNAASFQPGMPSGGALATVFCDGLSPVGVAVIPGTFTAPPGAPLPFELQGIRVMVNGAFAPILAVVIPVPGEARWQQINFQVPMERNATASQYPDTGTLTVLRRCPPESCFVSSPAFSTLNPEFVGGFFSDAKGYAIAQHASDFSPVTVQNPAHAGEAIIAYADDFFAVWPPPPTALPAPAQPLFPYAAIGPQRYFAGGLYLGDYPQKTSPFGGTPAPNTPPLQVTFAGLAPGQIGVEQINFVVPAGKLPGDWPLFYSNADGRIGNSSPYVLLPVR